MGTGWIVAIALYALGALVVASLMWDEARSNRQRAMLLFMAAFWVPNILVVYPITTAFSYLQQWLVRR